MLQFNLQFSFADPGELQSSQNR